MYSTVIAQYTTPPVYILPQPVICTMSHVGWIVDLCSRPILSRDKRFLKAKCYGVIPVLIWNYKFGLKITGGPHGIYGTKFFSLYF